MSTRWVDVDKVAGTHVDQVFIGSCTNGRFEDLKEAADVLRDHKFSDEVRVLVIPASKAEYLKALRSGIIEKFVLAGGTCRSSMLRAMYGWFIRAHRIRGGIIFPHQTVTSAEGRVRLKGRYTWDQQQQQPLQP